MARHPSQTLLAFTLDRSLADAVDDSSAGRGESRSQFIRAALVEYLRAVGHPVADNVIFAPDRRHREPAARVADEPDSDPTPERRPVTYPKPARKKTR